MTKASRLLRAEPLSPREVKTARLAPYEIKTRWGYPPDADVAGLPEQVRHEFAAAQAATQESQEGGTLREDYPQLYRVAGPFGDLVSLDGLTVHDWQL